MASPVPGPPAAAGPSSGGGWRRLVRPWCWKAEEIWNKLGLDHPDPDTRHFDHDQLKIGAGGWIGTESCIVAATVVARRTPPYP
ncbi:hypothetical protein BDV93DRAFT_524633 [Ceratobasidium sp. AG-I]|nr:hypothetical protein BDV93DRAFT_524633 [Ceratobasidium sp. AG-I]